MGCQRLLDEQKVQCSLRVHVGALELGKFLGVFEYLVVDASSQLTSTSAQQPQLDFPLLMRIVMGPIEPLCRFILYFLNYYLIIHQNFL
jgi:hypothetical protein